MTCSLRALSASSALGRVASGWLSVCLSPAQTAWVLRLRTSFWRLPSLICFLWITPSCHCPSTVCHGRVVNKTHTSPLFGTRQLGERPPGGAAPEPPWALAGRPISHHLHNEEGCLPLGVLTMGGTPAPASPFSSAPSASPGTPRGCGAPHAGPGPAVCGSYQHPRFLRAECGCWPRTSDPVGLSPTHSPHLGGLGGSNSPTSAKGLCAACNPAWREPVHLCLRSQKVLSPCGPG